MSANRNRIPLSEATEQANAVVKALEPYCTTIQIAGSIRRKKPDVGDIEIVCLPERQGLVINQQIQLFETIEKQMQPLPEFIRAVDQWKRVKGQASGKYTQRILQSGMKLDLFIATPENYGFLLAMRTGSSEFSKKQLGYRWALKGYESRDGILRRNGKIYPCPTEEELFKLVGIEWIEPHLRE